MHLITRILSVFLVMLFFSLNPAGYLDAEENEAQILQSQIEDAVKLFEKGKVDAAIYRLQQIHKMFPKNETVLFKLGEMAISSRNWAYAINVLDKAARLRPTDIEVRIVLMEIYRAYQMPIQEIITAREIIAIDPDNEVALRKLAYLYQIQAMPEEEESTRRALAKRDTTDHDNFNQLALLQEKKGAIYEEIVTREKIQKYFPDKIENELRLARAYGLEGELYSKLILLKSLRRNPQSKSPEIQREYEKTLIEYRKSFAIYDAFKPEFVFSKTEGSDEKTTSYTGRIAYQKLLFSQHTDVEVFADYKLFEYTPKGQLTGEKDIDGYRAGLIYQHRWKKAKTQVKAMGGIETVDVSGTVTAKNPGAIDPADYPWLQDRDYGGTAFIGSLAFEKKVNRNFGAILRIDRSLLEDLDAYARMYTHNSAGIGGYYQRRDGTRIDAACTYGRITHGNYRQRALFNFFYPLFISDSIQDYRGRRMGSQKPIPKQELNFAYEFEYIRDKDPSFYYQVYSETNEIRNSVTLSGRQRIVKDLYLMLEGTYTDGRVMKEATYYKAGIAYEEANRFNNIELAYFYQTDEFTDQINRTYLGKSRGYGIMLNALWHF